MVEFLLNFTIFIFLFFVYNISFILLDIIIITLQHDIVYQVAEQIDKKKENKYTVKPPKDLRSKFELKMEEKMRKEEEDREKKLLEEESQRIAVRYKIF